MGINDFSSFDDENEDDPSKWDGFEDELKKYRDMLKGNASSLTNIEALEEIVNYYFESEQYGDALHFIEQLLRLVPYSADNWQRKGVILSNLGKFEDAVVCYDHALNLNPVDPEILVNKGIALDDLGQTRGGPFLLRAGARDRPRP